MKLIYVNGQLFLVPFNNDYRRPPVTDPEQFKWGKIHRYPRPLYTYKMQVLLSWSGRYTDAIIYSPMRNPIHTWMIQAVHLTPTKNFPKDLWFNV